jgi:hypothetical protein
MCGFRCLVKMFGRFIPRREPNEGTLRLRFGYPLFYLGAVYFAFAFALLDYLSDLWIASLRQI